MFASAVQLQKDPASMTAIEIARRTILQWKNNLPGRDPNPNFRSAAGCCSPHCELLACVPVTDS